MVTVTWKSFRVLQTCPYWPIDLLAKPEPPWPVLLLVREYLPYITPTKPLLFFIFTPLIPQETKVFELYSMRPGWMGCWDKYLKELVWADGLVGLLYPSLIETEQLRFIYIDIGMLHNILFFKKPDAKITLKTSVPVDGEWKWINQIQ